MNFKPPHIVKTTYVLTSIFLAATLSYAGRPMTATTEDGGKILVDPNGTWRPVNATEPTFKKSEEATLYVKAPKGSFGVWINPKKWKQQVPAQEDSNKITFLHRSGDSFALIIAERAPLPMASLRSAVIANMKEAGTEVQVVSEEKRMVNGNEVLCLQLTATMQNVPFVYYGYYFGGREGALQVLTYTYASFFAEFKDDFDEFLNGTQVD